MTPRSACKKPDAIKPEQISENFSIAKLLAILMVATGHYFGSILWVPVTIGLFVFAFSSGYFSAKRYCGKIDWRSFWANKIKRLAPPLLVVNLFLLLLFLIEGKSGLLTFHTALAWLGLSGFLDWLGIHNQSPFGNGLWFFTVLLIFYAIFPLLHAVTSNGRRALAFIIVSAAICMLGRFYASPPYMLWLTIFGFCFGMFAARIAWKPRYVFSWLILLVCGVFLLGANLLGFKQLNLLLLAALSISTVAVLLSTPFRLTQVGSLQVLLPCVLEIYLLHTYLFVEVPGLPRIFGYVISMTMVLVLAYGLYRIRLQLMRRLS